MTNEQNNHADLRVPLSVGLGSNLLPCPFCGSKPIGPEPADTEWWVECQSCEVIMTRDSKKYLIECWNKRPNVELTG